MLRPLVCSNSAGPRYSLNPHIRELVPDLPLHLPGIAISLANMMYDTMCIPDICTGRAKQHWSTWVLAITTNDTSPARKHHSFALDEHEIQFPSEVGTGDHLVLSRRFNPWGWTLHISQLAYTCFG